MEKNQRERKAALEDLWRQRLHHAKASLDLAHRRMDEVERNLEAGLIPSSDGSYSYGKALRVEKLALTEYRRVLHLYSDLVLRGVIPDEAEGPH